MLAALSHLLNKAVEWGWIEQVPCNIKKVPDGARRDVYLTPEECNSFLEAARTIHHELYLFIKIGVLSGMRMSEIFSVELQNIDFQALSIYLPKAKAGARHQPISAELANYLRFYIKNYCAHDQRWLFPSEKSPTGHRNNITKIFNRAVKKAGITKKINRHTLRHTAVSLLIQKGADLIQLWRFRVIKPYVWFRDMRITITVRFRMRWLQSKGQLERLKSFD